MKLKGVIFDVDGTLVDSNDAHAAAFVAAFGEFGYEDPADLLANILKDPGSVRRSPS